jgi:aryl-alcohol dehydrogenase-like predicted oxidoreductase
MQRRHFLANVSAAGVLSGLDPAYLAAKEELATGKTPEREVERRKYGRTDERLSIIGFGGILVMNTTPEEAADYVAKAVERGVNYFDVAPSYGNAQDCLGPALKPHRPKVFLACKTLKRDAAGAKEELEASLKTLQTDHFDLYQLHALTKVEEVEQVFGPGGAMETFQKAKRAGKIRHIGFSAHDEKAALSAQERFDFDSILFPLGFPTWMKEGFGPAVHKKAKEAGRGILALKAMAHQKWSEKSRPDRRRWNKAWYEPFDDLDKVALGLRFTLHLPVTAMLTPGHWDLLKMSLDLAQSGALIPLNESERKLAQEIASKSDPIFGKHV